MHAIGLCDLFGFLDSFLVAVVPDGYVGAGLREGVSHCEPNTCSGTRDDRRAAFQREEGQDEVGERSGGAVVGEVPGGSDGAVHLEYLRVKMT